MRHEGRSHQGSSLLALPILSLIAFIWRGSRCKWSNGHDFIPIMIILIFVKCFFSNWGESIYVNLLIRYIETLSEQLYLFSYYYHRSSFSFSLWFYLCFLFSITWAFSLQRWFIRFEKLSISYLHVKMTYCTCIHYKNLSRKGFRSLYQIEGVGSIYQVHEEMNFHPKKKMQMDKFMLWCSS